MTSPSPWSTNTALPPKKWFGHHHHRPVGGRADRRALGHRVVGSAVGAARAPVDDAAVAEAAALGQRVERRRRAAARRGAGRASSTAAPSRGSRAGPARGRPRQVHHVARQRELLHGVVEARDPHGHALEPPAARRGRARADRACAAGRSETGRPRRSAALPPDAAHDSMPSPGQRTIVPGRTLAGSAPFPAEASTQAGSGQEDRRVAPAVLQRGPDSRFTSKSRATIPSTSRMSGVAVPGWLPMKRTRAPATAPSASSEARIPHQLATSPRR